MAKPVLYHMPQTRGGATLWMNEELGGVCDVKLVNFKAGDHKKPDYLSLNPMGKVPTLTHDGAVVTEAAAICAYLADAFPGAGLAPAANDPKRGVYFRWMFFAPSCIEPAMMDIFMKRKNENPGSIGYGNADQVIEAAKSAVSEGPYLLGETFTAADVAFGSTLNFAIMFGAFADEEPFTSYIARLKERPAFVSAMEKNNQYMKELGLE